MFTGLKLSLNKYGVNRTGLEQTFVEQMLLHFRKGMLLTYMINYNPLQEYFYNSNFDTVLRKVDMLRQLQTCFTLEQATDRLNQMSDMAVKMIHMPIHLIFLIYVSLNTEGIYEASLVASRSIQMKDRSNNVFLKMVEMKVLKNENGDIFWT